MSTGAIVFIAFAALFIFFAGILAEHYIGSKPKLNTEELLCAVDLIDVECLDKTITDSDSYQKVRLMRDELGRYMEMPGPSTVSKELKEIIDRVTVVVDADFEPEN